jgi:uncharacterized protein YndB with AHSA1/START domain
MKWVMFVVFAVLVVVSLAALVGWRLPQAHVSRREGVIPAPPEAVWAALTDIDAFPAWRSDVKKVTRLPDRDGRPVWSEGGSSGTITLAVEKSEPPHVLVLRIADPDLPFGGTWSYQVTAERGGSRLVIEEHGEIYNPLFRFMARFVFGYEATMASYVSSMEKRFAAHAQARR